jgi:hypothetical protein
MIRRGLREFFDVQRQVSIVTFDGYPGVRELYAFESPRDADRFYLAA